ncbi:MAG: hypothetical protein ACRESZ_15260 [Methylococcales bacterium]
MRNLYGIINWKGNENPKHLALSASGSCSVTRATEVRLMIHITSTAGNSCLTPFSEAFRLLSGQAFLACRSLRNRRLPTPNHLALQKMIAGHRSTRKTSILSRWQP